MPNQANAMRARKAAKTPPAGPGPQADRSSPASTGDTDTQRILRRWREKRPPDRLAHLVKDTIRTLDRALQMRLAEHDVSIGHWPFLRVLWEGDGLTQRELSREAGVMEPTTVAALNAMETLGYVVRRPVAGDRRKRHVLLTARGRALETSLVPIAREINAIAVRDVPETDLAATRRTLLAMLGNLAADEARAGAAPRRIPSTRELGRRVGHVAGANRPARR